VSWRDRRAGDAGGRAAGTVRIRPGARRVVVDRTRADRRVGDVIGVSRASARARVAAARAVGHELRCACLDAAAAAGRARGPARAPGRPDSRGARASGLELAFRRRRAVHGRRGRGWTCAPHSPRVAARGDATCRRTLAVGGASHAARADSQLRWSRRRAVRLSRRHPRRRARPAVGAESVVVTGSRFVAWVACAHRVENRGSDRRSGRGGALQGAGGGADVGHERRSVAGVQCHRHDASRGDLGPARHLVRLAVVPSGTRGMALAAHRGGTRPVRLERGPARRRRLRVARRTLRSHATYLADAGDIRGGTPRMPAHRRCAPLGIGAHRRGSLGAAGAPVGGVLALVRGSGRPHVERRAGRRFTAGPGVDGNMEPYMGTHVDNGPHAAHGHDRAGSADSARFWFGLDHRTAREPHRDTRHLTRIRAGGPGGRIECLATAVVRRSSVFARGRPLWVGMARARLLRGSRCGDVACDSGCRLVSRGVAGAPPRPQAMARAAEADSGSRRLAVVVGGAGANSARTGADPCPRCGTRVCRPHPYTPSRVAVRYG
jgi:hypothetical protein